MCAGECFETYDRQFDRMFIRKTWLCSLPLTVLTNAIRGASPRGWEERAKSDFPSLTSLNIRPLVRNVQQRHHTRNVLPESRSRIDVEEVAWLY